MIKPPPEVIRAPVSMEHPISPVTSHVTGTPIAVCEQTGRSCVEN